MTGRKRQRGVIYKSTSRSDGLKSLALASDKLHAKNRAPRISGVSFTLHLSLHSCVFGIIHSRTVNLQSCTGKVYRRYGFIRPD